MLGSTRLRNQLLQARGLVVVCVPWWEWAAQKRAPELEDAYLRRLLHAHGVGLEPQVVR